MFSLQVMSILAPQKYIDNKEEVLFARSPIPNFLNYLRRRRRGKESTKPIDDDDVDVLDDDTAFGIDDSFDFAQFVRTHGHRIDHMIKKCRWKSQPCGPENFTAVITEFGLCYTFNSGEYQTWGRGGLLRDLKVVFKSYFSEIPHVWNSRAFSLTWTSKYAYLFLGTKESFYMRGEFNPHRTFSVHQYGRHEVIWKQICWGGWAQFCGRSAVTRVMARVLN